MSNIFRPFAVLSIVVLLGPAAGRCDSYRIITPKGETHSVSMELHDTEVHSALKMLAEIENSNIAFQRDVTGKVRSFVVSGVPAQQVFDIILRMKGLYAEAEGNVVIVYPIEEYIKNAKARRELWGEQ